ncbi:MAG: DUF262 domain-containing HNH endonuclease family protein [Hyphomicrobium sp.]
MFIRSTVLPIEKVYAGDCRLELPWFQRAYAWSEPHVGLLIHDLLVAMTSPKRRYSLGHISLARPNGAPMASIIDGHQRSISLTMLFALLRDLIGDEAMRNRLHALIEVPGLGWRLMPQPAIAAFFQSFVQERGSTLVQPPGDIMDRSLSELNILANRDHMCSELRKAGMTEDTLVALATFLLEDCLAIVDEVEDEDEARDILRREEETGLSPHSSELAKATILSAMPSDEQEEASGLFESAQTQISADDMSNLLAHIRLLKVRRRSSRAVDGELVQRFKLNKTGLPFLKTELLPRASAMARLNRREIGSGESRAKIVRSLDLLYWIDHQMWVPAALHWLAVRGEDHPETAQFFSQLDRLTYLLKIASVDPTDQEHRYLRVLDAIDGTDPIDRMVALSIEKPLLKAALENLRSRTFYAKRFHSLVLRRISVHMLSDRDPGPVDGVNVTVEHVLPRRPEPDALWRSNFRPEEVSDYCHRIGNLAFLSQAENDMAGNSDFLVKALILANTRSAFILSIQAAQEKSWTKEVIVRRGEELIALLLEPWQLSATK